MFTAKLIVRDKQRNLIEFMRDISDVSDVNVNRQIDDLRSQFPANEFHIDTSQVEAMRRALRVA